MFKDDKLEAKKRKADEKYIKSITKELKQYGFAYVVNTRDVLDEIKEKFPNVEIRKLETMYEVAIR